MPTGITDRCPVLGFILIRNLNLHRVHKLLTINILYKVCYCEQNNTRFGNVRHKVIRMQSFLLGM